MVALAAEDLVLLDADDDVEIAADAFARGRGFGRRRFAFARDADDLAVADAGRDAHGELGFLVDTLPIIRELGLLYDSSLMGDDDPYELEEQGEATGIIELPPEWIRDDAPYFNFVRFSALRPYTPPSGVEEIFRAEFDGAYAENGLFLLTMHPHVIGHRSRIAMLDAWWTT